VSPYRPDLVDCWIFRASDGPAKAEILLIRRSPGRILPGLWQCVSGSLEAGERVALAALREVHEETGLGATAIEAFYDLDLVNQFHEPSVDGVMLSAIFAVRIRNDVEPVLSPEHTAFRWVELQAAWDEVIWPGYRHAIERIRSHLQDPAREVWFRLALDGSRLADADQPGGPGAGVDSGPAREQEDGIE
jgi:dATP pyrophosphohydrolase